MSVLNFYKDYVYTPTMDSTISIKKDKLTSIIQNILANKTPFFLYVSDYTTDSKEYYTTSILKDKQIKQINLEISESLSFSPKVFFQYLLTYIYLQRLYKIDFDPSKIYYYLTDDKIETQYLINKDFRINISSFNLQETPVINEKRLLFSLKETPSYLIDNISYTNNNLNEYNDRLIYLYGIFMLYKHNETDGDFFIKSLNDESLRRLIIEASEKDDFEMIKNFVVLSQFPSFTDYFRNIYIVFKTQDTSPRNIYLLKNIDYEPFYFIKYNKIDQQFNSNILLAYNQLCGSKVTINDKNKDFDKDLIKQLYTTLNNYKYPYIATHQFYKFPFNVTQELNNIDKNISNNFIFSGQSLLYLQILCQTLINSGYNIDKTIKSMLFDNYTTYFYEKGLDTLSQILKPYFFSINMLSSPYGKIYRKGLENNNVNKYISTLIPNVSSPELSPTIYYPQYTLSQFYALIHLYNKKYDLQKLISKIIFYWSDDKNYTNKNINDILSNATIGNDLEIYKKLKLIHFNNNPHTSFDRGFQRIKDLQKFNFFNLLTITPTFKYLDFGGGNGELTSALAKYLKLNKSNTFVTDIQSWFGSENVVEYTSYVSLRYIKTSLLPFEDDSFDLVSAFQVFHHIKDVDKSLQEIYRILKPNGLLLIREHDCDSIATRTLIDLDHSLREISLVDDIDITDFSFLHTYEDKYFSMKNMTDLIIKHNFIEKNMNYPFPKGTTRYYYKVFIKNDMGILQNKIKKLKIQ
jgi:ubiquinone/menaquinone biosynthesis C-methylase UbiE